MFLDVFELTPKKLKISILLLFYMKIDQMHAWILNWNYKMAIIPDKFCVCFEKN